MDEAARLLEERKQLLIARSSLQRLQLQQGVQALRSSATPRAALSLARASPLRSAILGGLMLVAGRQRVARLVSAAMAAVAIAKAVRAATAWLRSRR